MAETEPLKKGRGKSKQVEVAESELSDQEIVGKSVPEKKKRGRKAANVPVVLEHKEPVAKRGKKKASSELIGNGDKEDSPVLNEEMDDENAKPNGNTEPVANSKGKKKPTIKDSEKADKSARVKKGKLESTAEEDGETIEENAKPAIKSRGRKVKTDKETEQKAETSDDVKTEPAPKGKKKNPGKSTTEVLDDKNNEGQSAKADLLATKGKKKTMAKVESEPQDKQHVEDHNEDEPVSKGKKKTPAKSDLIPVPEGQKTEEGQREVAEDNPEEKKPTKGKKASSKKTHSKVETEDNALESESAGKKKKVAKKEEKGKGSFK